MDPRSPPASAAKSWGAWYLILAGSGKPVKDPRWLLGETLVTQPWLLHWQGCSTTPRWACCGNWLLSYGHLNDWVCDPWWSRITQNPLAPSQVEQTMAKYIPNESSRHFPSKVTISSEAFMLCKKILPKKNILLAHHRSRAESQRASACPAKWSKTPKYAALANGLRLRPSPHGDPSCSDSYGGISISGTLRPGLRLFKLDIGSASRNGDSS